MVGVALLIELRSATTSHDHVTRWRRSRAARSKTTADHLRRRRIDFFAPVNVISTGSCMLFAAADDAKTLTYDQRPQTATPWPVAHRSTADERSWHLPTTHSTRSLLLRPNCCIQHLIPENWDGSLSSRLLNPSQCPMPNPSPLHVRGLSDKKKAFVTYALRAFPVVDLDDSDLCMF